MEDAQATQVAPVLEACLPYERKTIAKSQPGDTERLVDCIECGLCISACPSALTSATYVGPAILAAAQHTYLQTGDASLLHGADSHEGLWGCHSAYECSAVCPSNVDPAWRIMDLRKKIDRPQHPPYLWQEREGFLMTNHPSPSNFWRWFDPRNRQIGTWGFILNRITALGLTLYLGLHLIALGQLAQGPRPMTRSSPW